MSDITRRDFMKDVAALGAAGLVNAEPVEQSVMVERTIPRSNERLPVVGVGTWRTFDPREITPETLAPLEATLRVFHNAGGKVIDSSPMYGKSEDVTGRVSKKLGIN